MLVALGASTALLSGCATGRPDGEGSDSSEVSDTENPAAAEVAALAGIPQETHPRIDHWIKYFSETDKTRFQRFLKQGGRYKEVVERILEEVGVPAELYYLAMIESGYQTHATSRARAVGVWQFINATGKRYGLESTSHVDDRRDPIRATEAAAKYLRDLYNVFGSWHLALAAYNAGEFRVMRAIVTGKSRDFWELCAKGALPRETEQYVPKFFAAVAVGQNPDKYDFEELPDNKYPSLESIEAPPTTSLSEIAERAGIPESEIADVNPQLVRKKTPPTKYEIWVPAERVKAVTAGMNELWAELPKRKKAEAERAVASSSKHGAKFRIVKRGETLAEIARQTSMSVAYLKAINELKSDRIPAGKRLRLTARSYNARRTLRHRVQNGETLTSIARRYRVSVAALKRLNSLESDQVQTGQNLRVGAR